MRSLNNKIKFLYILIIFSSLINILGVLNIIPMIKMLNIVLWVIVFIIGIFITHNDYNHFYNVKDKIQTIFIILLLYFMIYFSLGLIFGFSHNVYNNSSINMILNNFSYFVLPVIFQEYIRGILCNYSKGNNKILVFISIMYILINFNYTYVNNIFNTGETFFKFLSLNVLPLVATEFVMTYLCSVSSYKTSMFYKILMAIYVVYLPVIPNINFFLNGIILVAVPVIVYFVIDSYNEKETKKIYVDYKKSFIFEYSPIMIVVIIFICNLLGVFKYQMLSIMSNSMNPLYYRGDAVVIEKLSNKSKKNLKKGDIVSYYDKRGNLIVHRINNIYSVEKNTYVITKGDNNNEVDNVKINIKDIEGKYLFHVKYLGYPRVVIHDILMK